MTYVSSYHVMRFPAELQIWQRKTDADDCLVLSETRKLKLEFVTLYKMRSSRQKENHTADSDLPALGFLLQEPNGNGKLS